MLTVWLFVACQSESNNDTPDPAPSTDGAAAAVQTTRALIKNVMLRITDRGLVHILELYGELAPKNNQVTDFDDAQTYSVTIGNARVSLTPSDLSLLLNDHAFAYEDTPIKEVEIKLEGNEIQAKGTLDKVINIPFEIRGNLSVTPQGHIALTPTSVRAAGVSVKGLLDLFGAEVEDVVNLYEARGIRIEDNTIIISLAVMPPPSVHGRFTSVDVRSGRIELSLEGSASPGKVATPRRGKLPRPGRRNSAISHVDYAGYPASAD